MFTKFKVFIRRADLKLRRSLLRSAGLKVTGNYYLENPMGKSREDVERLSLYSDSTTFTRPSLTDSKFDITYNYPKRYVYKIPNAIIDPQTGLIYDQTGKLIAESSAWNITRLLCETPRPQIKIPRLYLKGDYSFISSIPNYYHWLLEELAPFLAAFKHDQNINVLTGATKFSLQEEFFEHYLKQEVTVVNSPVQVENLIMTGKTSGFGNPFGHNAIHPHDLDVVTDFFQVNEGHNKNKANLKIYLSRTGYRRSPEGESKLDKTLKDKGFIIFNGNMGLKEQRELFSQVSLVVGASGAAMVNLLWLKPEAKVVMLNFNGERYHFYYDLALMRKLCYYSIDMPQEKWSDTDIEQIVSFIDYI